MRALSTRLRNVFESAQGDVEIWSKTAISQLDIQLRERRRNFARRTEAVERIEQAAGGLDERMSELRAQNAHQDSLEHELRLMTADLVNLHDDDAAGFSTTLPPD
jgi:vacuolar-type H+-ATPase subunit E/Vma4